ncbi:MAG: NAD-dependent epimerase/dehydratase family protein [Jiangellaceae bacterium]
MPVVVTGAAGFIGTAVVSCLLGRGDRVVAIDRRPLAERTGLVSLQADLCDDEAMVVAALRSADAVVHLAGCPGVRDRLPDVERRRQWDNVEATRAVLAATPVDVPVVVVSSSSVYGGARLGRASREDDPCRPVGGYAASKVRAEQVCAGRLASGAPLVVARPFTAVGEGQRPDMAIARWVAAARTGQPLRILGGLDRTRDFTDVREVARALTALVGATGVVNVGTGRPRTLGEAVETVRAVVGVEPVVTVAPAAPEEVRDTWADTSRLAELTGLSLRTNLLDAVSRAAATPVLEAVG